MGRLGESPSGGLRAAALWGVAAALIAAATAGPFAESGPGKSLDQMALDLRWRLRGPVAPPQSVAVLAVTDATAADAGGWPLSHDYLATGLDNLRAAGAAAVGLDLLFAEVGETGAGEDPLAAAFDRWDGRSVAAMAPVYAKAAAPSAERLRAVAEAGYASVLRDGARRAAAPTEFLLPAGDLAQHTGLGHVGVSLDGAGAPFSWPLALPAGDAYAPSMPLELYRIRSGAPRAGVIVDERAGVALGDRLVAAGPRLERGLAYYGAGDAFRTIPFEDVARGRLPAGALDGVVAFIGVTGVSGVSDAFPTPYEARAPGVTVLATATANLIEGDVVVFGAQAALSNLIAMGLAAALCAALASRLPLRFALGGLALAALAWLGLGQWLFVAGGVSLSPISLLAGAAAALTVTASRRLRLRALWRQGRRVTAMMLFADLADTTAGAEALGDAAASRRIARFHGLFEEEVSRRGGVVVGWSGDAALAIFEVADGDWPACAEAWAAARALAQASNERLRVGLHFGAAKLTKLGRAASAPVTPIGDAVNVAARLLDVAKAEATPLVVSDDAQRAIAREAGAEAVAELRALPPQSLRGRSEAVGAWALAGDEAESPA